GRGERSGRRAWRRMLAREVDLDGMHELEAALAVLAAPPAFRAAVGRRLLLRRSVPGVGAVARRAQLPDRQAVAGAAGRLAGAAQQRHVDHRGDADEREHADPEPQSATIPSVIGELESLTTRARALAGRGERAILGIAGAPGGGKSTLAAALVAELGEAAVLVPMDGFHLAQAELVRQGARD